MLKRRSFLKMLAALPFARRGFAGTSLTPPEPPVPPRSGQGPYSGDEFVAAHRYLLDGAPIPAPATEDPVVRDVLIAGAGPSGLIAAWKLKKRDYLVLEKDRLPGGTSKMETWNGLPYAIGAAYLGVPDPGTELDRFYGELGLKREWRTFGDPDMGIFYGPRKEMAYWDRKDARAIGQAFTRMLKERYCDMPFTPSEAWTRAEMEEIDRESWKELLARGLPARRGKPRLPIPPAVQEFCALFAPAALSAEAGEVSAWVLLNQFLAEFGPLACFPGGNGHLTARLVERLERLKPGRIRTSHFVLRIETGPETVSATVLGPDGTCNVLRARSLVFTGPKFLAPILIPDLPPDQKSAIDEIKYRPFLVANVLLKKPVFDRRVYDMYTTGLEGSDLSDITFADYAARSTAPTSVLTCYIPLPRDSGRTELLADANIAKFRARTLGDLKRLLGDAFDPADVEDVRFARWGHPIVVPGPGQFSRGIFDRASRPFGRIVFANQDNLGNPCIEACYSAAGRAAGEVRRILRQQGPGRG